MLPNLQFSLQPQTSILEHYPYMQYDLIIYNYDGCAYMYTYIHSKRAYLQAIEHMINICLHHLYI